MFEEKEEITDGSEENPGNGFLQCEKEKIDESEENEEIDQIEGKQERDKSEEKEEIFTIKVNKKRK